MRRYETMVILEPDLPEERRKPVLERVEDTIQKDEGFLIEFDDWGNRKMAYEIKRKGRGHYIRIDYCGTGDTVREMERFFRIDDRVMRFLTVLLEEEPDVAAIQEAMKAESERQAEEAEAAEAQAAETAEEAEEAAPETETEQPETETEPKTEPKTE
jgi:small subunit ribosomal protein S6